MPNNRPYMLLGFDLQMQAGSEEAEIMIYGYIVSNKYGENNPDVTALEFDKLLKQAKKNGVKRLLLRINSGGGSVFQAVSMKTMLMEANFEKITVRIDGLCASAATLFPSLPGVHVRMAEGGMLMIHNPSDIVWGTAKDMEDGARRLHAIESDMHSIYARRTGLPEEEIAKMMDDETWLTAKMAKEKGFVDEILDGQGMAAAQVQPDIVAAMTSIYKNMPQMAAYTQANNSETPVAGVTAAVINQPDEEDEDNMPMDNLTREQLQAENSSLHDTILNDGVRMERERIREIRNVTPAGYEQMANEAIEQGTSVNDYMRQVLTAQRERGSAFVAQRQTETAPANQIPGSAAPEAEDKSEAKMIADNAKEVSAFAKEFLGIESKGTMF